ncbi:calcium/sodium antiporter [[Clostridium] spiroforme]|nr:calcium/sodium antiporter [Thomasclavelia spiroformis]MBM6879089.1 calcium/sodium antiporter [Thomasclavelia spiroformis]MBM6930632.1 calcium/sodium antiporter [Thomasclavelia spiroformis]
MLLEIWILIIGFILLMKGADWFVEGASHLAGRFHIPQIVIGLTIVAFGTSAPEAAISITSALKNSNDLAIGNIIGSNIINVLVILGIVGLITKLKVKKTTYNYEIPFVLVITLLMLILAKWDQSLNRLDGLILLLCFGLFFIYLIYMAKSQNEDNQGMMVHSFARIMILLIVGITGILAGSQLTINAAEQIALALGVSKRVIGLTVVAFGTSLPELVTSLVAAWKQNDDLSVGNIIGSNIFNILFILGMSVLLKGQIPFNDRFIVDGIVAIIALMVLYGFIDRNYYLRRIGALVMLLLYGAYFILIM